MQMVDLKSILPGGESVLSVNDSAPLNLVFAQAVRPLSAYVLVHLVD